MRLGSGLVGSRRGGEMTLSKNIRKNVIGKKIVKLRLNRFSTRVAGNPYSYDPVFVLEDGTRIAFVVAETETGEYGIEPVIVTELKGRPFADPPEEP